MAFPIVCLIDEQNYLYGFTQTLKDHSFDLVEVTDVTEANRVWKGPSLALYTGDGQKPLWNWLQSRIAESPQLQIVAVVPAEFHDNILKDWGDRITCVQPLTSRNHFLQLIQKLMKSDRPRAHSPNFLEGNSALAGFNPHFFDTLEIHEVLSRALQHLGAKILCENIHWVQWAELKHVAETDAQILDLEVETKYHRTPKLRSLHETSVQDVVRLVRSFPLVKKFPHLTEGNFLLLNSGSRQHLLFPILDHTGHRNFSCLLIENLHDGEPEFIIKQVRSALSAMVRHIEFAYELWAAKNESFLDDLTSLYNQRYLPLVLDSEMARSKRAYTKFSVLFMDLDHFKKVNDNKGHWVGSQLLIEMGKIVKGNIRSCDYGFRYGGDEFVVILVDTDAQGAQVVAERLRKQVEESTFLVDGHSMRLTVSVGVACFPDHAKTRQDVIRMADEAMYHGKHKSRNIVYVAS